MWSSPSADSPGFSYVDVAQVAPAAQALANTGCQRAAGLTCGSFLPVRSAASTMRRASAAVFAMGFSHTRVCQLQAAINLTWELLGVHVHHQWSHLLKAHGNPCGFASAVP